VKSNQDQTEKKSGLDMPSAWDNEDGGSDEEGQKESAEAKAEAKSEKKKRRPRRMAADDEEAKAEDKPTVKHTDRQGWGSPTKDEESGGGGKPRADEEEDEEDDVPRGRRRNLRDIEEDETEMVMMIPDLEEDESEDITLQVAAAPRSVARRVQSLQQLDHDLKYAIPSGGGLDLGFLTASLVPPSMVQDEDTTWDFDSLLQQVTQEFTAEAEKLAEANKERKTGVGELAKADEAKSFGTTGDRRQRSTPRA